MPVRISNSGEVYRAGERLPSPDPVSVWLAHLLDGSIPVGRFTVGLDPLLGLLPGIGDLIGAALAMIIVMRAVQAGVPRVAVARMMANIAIDTVIGSIPLFGDAFDFAYKSNLMNLKIYEDSLRNPRAARVRHWGFFVTVFLLAALGLAAIIVGVFALARRAF